MGKDASFAPGKLEFFTFTFSLAVLLPRELSRWCRYWGLVVGQ